jgi:putative FmdB family regulatory protein
MPLYEYQCQACARTFERIQKFSDPLETVCPTCGGLVRKLLSSPAFQFKGSGFYITDYARKGEKGDQGEKTSESGAKAAPADAAGEGASSKDAGDKAPASKDTSAGESSASSASSSAGAASTEKASGDKASGG